MYYSSSDDSILLSQKSEIKNTCVPVHLVIQVTLLVLVDGEYLIPSLKGYTPHVEKVDIKTALQTIHSIPRSDLEVSLVSLPWTSPIPNVITHNS